MVARVLVINLPDPAKHGDARGKVVEMNQPNAMCQNAPKCLNGSCWGKPPKPVSVWNERVRSNSHMDSVRVRSDISEPKGSRGEWARR
jgi:hypothetical protein